MRITITLLLSFLIVGTVQSQFRMGSAVSYANGGARVTVQSVGDVSIDKEMTLGNTALIFAGGTNNLSITNSLTLLGLGLGNGSNVTMSGDLTVTGDIIFEDGYITPGSNRLLYTGPEILEGSDASHVRGMMWSRGTGVRSFPIASSDNLYAPFVLQGVTEGDVDLGVTAFHSNASVTNIPPTIPDVSTDWYWQLETRGSTFSGAVVTLPILVGDAGLFSGQNVSGVVLQASGTRDLVESLGGSVGVDAVTSTESGTGPLFLLGTVMEVQLSIHNIISPNGDGINDFLVIENLGLLGTNNEVVLLDRWGVRVYEKTGFENFDAISNPYDGSFDFLEPGNYICILKIPNRETMTQTITVVRE